MTEHQNITTRRRKKDKAREPSLFRYAVIDLASAPQLIPAVTGKLKHEARPIFSPNFPIELLAVGPWLADLSKLPELDAILNALDSTLPWGYFVHASVDMTSLRHALRHFNLVEIPNPNRSVLFRYWDPRVMKAFLRIADRAQKDRLFHFIDRIEGSHGSFDVSYDAAP